ncbi:MAG: hypothetical protein F8N36_14175 [Desulfovibrio sp.]|uniref:hypothetical protein n=1 Tax=Desulfovibrio sp. TaxID=885 RepID=UPI00135DBEE2|nr:hypothetical protein [Desulfovibrio sp.]MTJ93986.1 hypothetical protein [Desulfovibrio sp.]
MAEKLTNERMQLSLGSSLRKVINDWRFQNRVGTENEAVRRLLKAGLKAEGMSLPTEGDPSE